MTDIIIDTDKVFEECVDEAMMGTADIDIAPDESHRQLLKVKMRSISLDIEESIRCRLKGVRRSPPCSDVIGGSEWSRSDSITYCVDTKSIDPEELSINIRDTMKTAVLGWWYSQRNPQLAEIYNDALRALHSKLKFLTKGSYAKRPYRMG